MGVNIFVYEYIFESNSFVENEDFDWDRKAGDNDFANTVKTGQLQWESLYNEKYRPVDIEQAVIWLFRYTDHYCYNRLIPVLKEMTYNPDLYFEFNW